MAFAGLMDAQHPERGSAFVVVMTRELNVGVLRRML